MIVFGLEIAVLGVEVACGKALGIGADQRLGKHKLP